MVVFLHTHTKTTQSSLQKIIRFVCPERHSFFLIPPLLDYVKGALFTATHRTRRSLLDSPHVTQANQPLQNAMSEASAKTCVRESECISDGLFVDCAVLSAAGVVEDGVEAEHRWSAPPWADGSTLSGRVELRESRKETVGSTRTSPCYITELIDYTEPVITDCCPRPGRSSTTFSTR